MEEIKWVLKRGVWVQDSVFGVLVEVIPGVRVLRVEKGVIRNRSRLLRRWNCWLPAIRALVGRENPCPLLLCMWLATV